MSDGLTQTVPTHPGSDGGCACGAPPHPTIANRCVAGHVARGNAIARTTGLHASALVEAVVAERARFEAQSLADDGGDVPQRRRAQHAYRARLHSHIVQLSDAIERFGLFDKRGRLRVAWLQRLEGLVLTAARLDAALGLARQSRPVPSIAEYITKTARDGGPK